MRTIPQIMPTIDAMNLPHVLKDVAMTKRGLVIFVGATGSGKSTSLAAMVDHRNENSFGHIITIEDPVEFVHPHKNCIITQREVGIDTDDLGVALKNTLRQAPDVILMGEIRDRETMEHAVAFAETGHLCLATLHANSANQALDRIINFFPEERRAQLLMDLFAQPEEPGVAAPVAAPGGQGPGGRGRDPAQHAADLRPDLQGRGRRDQGDHEALARARHADLRPEPVRPVTRARPSPTRTRCATPTR